MNKTKTAAAFGAETRCKEGIIYLLSGEMKTAGICILCTGESF
jgi:hypothetical protein